MKKAKIELPRKVRQCAHCDGNGFDKPIDGSEMRRIRQRERPHLSGRSLAAQLGLSAAYLSDMELGRREMSEETARRILEICNA